MIEPLRFHSEKAPTFAIKHPIYCGICLMKGRKSSDTNVAVKFCTHCDKHYFQCLTCDEETHRIIANRHHVRRTIVLGPGIRKRVITRGDAYNFPLLFDEVHIRYKVKVFCDGNIVHKEPSKHIKYSIGLSGKCIHVQILSARNLISGDFNGTSDPFIVSMYCGKKLGSTRVRPRTLNPRWTNETVIIPIDHNLPQPRNMPRTQKDLFRLEVFDYDHFTSNDMIGHVELSKDRLITLAAQSEQRPIRLYLSSKQFHGILGIQFGMNLSLGLFLLRVNRAEAISKGNPFFGLSNPYAKIFYGEELIGRTSVAKNTLDPEWETSNSFEFKINRILAREIELLHKKQIIDIAANLRANKNKKYDQHFYNNRSSLHVGKNNTESGLESKSNPVISKSNNTTMNNKDIEYDMFGIAQGTNSPSHAALRPRTASPIASNTTSHINQTNNKENKSKSDGMKPMSADSYGSGESEDLFEPDIRYTDLELDSVTLFRIELYHYNSLGQDTYLGTVRVTIEYLRILLPTLPMTPIPEVSRNSYTVLSPKTLNRINRLKELDRFKVFNGFNRFNQIGLTMRNLFDRICGKEKQSETIDDRNYRHSISKRNTDTNHDYDHISMPIPMSMSIPIQSTELDPVYYETNQRLLLDSERRYLSNPSSKNQTPMAIRSKDITHITDLRDKNTNSQKSNPILNIHNNSSNSKLSNAVKFTSDEKVPDLIESNTTKDMLSNNQVDGEDIESSPLKSIIKKDSLIRQSIRQDSIRTNSIDKDKKTSSTSHVNRNRKYSYDNEEDDEEYIPKQSKVVHKPPPLPPSETVDSKDQKNLVQKSLEDSLQNNSLEGNLEDSLDHSLQSNSRSHSYDSYNDYSIEDQEENDLENDNYNDDNDNQEEEDSLHEPAQYSTKPSNTVTNYRPKFTFPNLTISNKEETIDDKLVVCEDENGKDESDRLLQPVSTENTDRKIRRGRVSFVNTIQSILIPTGYSTKENEEYSRPVYFLGTSSSSKSRTENENSDNTKSSKEKRSNKPEDDIIWSHIRHFKIEKRNKSILEDVNEDRGYVVVRLIPSNRGQVITGLDESVRRMSLGETSSLLLRYDYAYGNFCVGAHIPPRANMIFKVQLLEINNMGRLELSIRIIRRIRRFVKRLWNRLYNNYMYHKQNKPMLESIMEYLEYLGILSNRNNTEKDQNNLDSNVDSFNKDRNNIEENDDYRMEEDRNDRDLHHVNPKYRKFITKGVLAGSKYQWGYNPKPKSMVNKKKSNMLKRAEKMNKRFAAVKNRTNTVSTLNIIKDRDNIYGYDDIDDDDDSDNYSSDEDDDDDDILDYSKHYKQNPPILSPNTNLNRSQNTMERVSNPYVPQWMTQILSPRRASMPMNFVGGKSSNSMTNNISNNPSDNHLLSPRAQSMITTSSLMIVPTQTMATTPQPVVSNTNLNVPNDGGSSNNNSNSNNNQNDMDVTLSPSLRGNVTSPRRSRRISNRETQERHQSPRGQSS